MTEVVVQAKKAYDRKEYREFSFDDWKPDWSFGVRLNDLVKLSTWFNFRRKLHKTFGDHMREKWNDPRHVRGPYHYFGHVLIPVGIEQGTHDVLYTYKPWTPESDRLFKGTLRTDEDDKS